LSKRQLLYEQPMLCHQQIGTVLLDEKEGPHSVWCPKDAVVKVGEKWFCADHDPKKHIRPTPPPKPLKIPKMTKKRAEAIMYDWLLNSVSIYAQDQIENESHNQERPPQHQQALREAWEKMQKTFKKKADQ